ncbi:large conductance mechanosensitive channel protein MscL [Lutispora saccharofermentans]|uniref:Large-conductance mechanosensitive channel n=1 Tax=Lutispora saccharofermentans TaxID=3024236 RepID=A0ABT1NAG1_9FIRM|nr:large conductance mechanosensitive channel protein MscL [Lutispora saccharofermentans]MCQ1528233.1 large conductance mechanosensitive channel protein MscL [Lutispora saccharofermentans]
MLQEFKKFALKGNVLDLAIGVIIGGAFGKIVTSLVNDVLMPIIGLLLGGVDFSGLEISIGDAAIKYGAFIQSIVDFLIITFSIFLFIKAVTRFKKKEEEKPSAPPAEEVLLTEIRDILRDHR